MNQKRINEFIQRLQNAGAGEGERLLGEMFPVGDPDRGAAQAVLRRFEATRGIDEAKEREIRQGEPLEVEGFEIQQRMGEGGNGFVYLAHQRQPKRLVAIKFLRGRLDGANAALMEREMVYLTRLRHADVVKLFAAGVTEFGRPYFVMEYLTGQPADVFVHQHALDLRERLKLFARICRAVEHAHQATIVHRDIKPSNVLVTMEQPTPQTREPAPKVIDFGIARLSYPDPDDELAARLLRQQPYTKDYASPELRRNEPVGPATDVYSLGRLLCRMVAETLPHLERPEPLSALVREHKPEWEKACRGDLDAIVAKTLEEQPGRRYQTPGLLAEDVENYLAGRPVAAIPATLGYVSKRFVARHPLWVALSGVLLAGLLVASGLAWWQRGEAIEAAARAQANEQRAVDALKTAEKEREKYYAMAAALRKGAVDLTARFTENILRQNEAMSQMYQSLAETFREPLEIQETLLSRALEVMPAGPERDLVAGRLDAVKRQLRSAARGGEGDLPKGATPLMMLNAQLQLALIHFGATQEWANAELVRRAIRAAMPMRLRDAEGSAALHATVCGASPEQQSLRKEFSELEVLCK